MKPTTTLPIIAALVLLALHSAPAQVPNILNYQGRVTVGGTNLTTNAALFKFALVSEGINANYPAELNPPLVQDGAVTFVGLQNGQGGLGYVTPPQVTVSDETGTGAVVEAVLTGSTVTSFNVVNGGSGYSQNATVSIEPPPASNTYSTYWNNDGATSGDGSEPATAVTVSVAQGLYSALLGDTTLANMAAIPASVFTNGNVNLRVWFSPGGAEPFVELTPDQRIAASGYALRAATAATVDTPGIGNLNTDPSSNVLGGGQDNYVGGGIFGPWATLGGGRGNRVDASYSFVGGGENNLNSGSRSVIGGGYENTNTGSATIIGGGWRNNASGDYAAIAGGRSNNISANYAAIGGGAQNTNSGNYSVLGGGERNTLTAAHGVIGGGVLNTLNGYSGTIGGGSGNTAGPGNDPTVSGGSQNTASGTAATVGGGIDNTANGSFAATVGGGYNNTASGDYATVPGGAFCSAAHNRSFVWGDGSVATASWGTNTFTVRASGGIRFYTSTNTTTGPRVAAGGTDFISSSDSNLKTKVTAVDPRAILAKLSQLPVTEWEYKHNPNRRYIGPMAQDFHAAFGLGEDDKGIGTLDSDGVMYAAIQGLVEELHDRDKTIEELKAWSMEQGARSRAEVDELKAKLQAVEQRLNSLPPVP